MSIEALGLSGVSGSLAAPLGGPSAGTFEQAMTAAEAQASGAPAHEDLGLQKILGALDQVNGEFSELAARAEAAQGAGAALSPSEMIMLTVRCQEFMFHCELTANMATTSSNGLQQLFQEQG
jgi:hypothetical protein